MISMLKHHRIAHLLVPNHSIPLELGTSTAIVLHLEIYKNIVYPN